MMNKGTLVVSTIRPITQGLGIPTVLSDEVKGGFHSVSDSTERDNIPVGIRQLGMLVYLTSTDTWFQLRTVIDSDLSNNSNWALVQIEDSTQAEWQDSVLSVLSDPSVLTPVPGDRHLVETPGVGDWNLRDNQIAIYDPTATPVPWNFIVPVENMSLRRTDDDNSVYYFDGSGWLLEEKGGSVFHNVEVGQQVFVGTGSHYLVYGDLTNAGVIVNFGKVITLNGNYVGLTGSVFDILGTGSYQSVSLLSELEAGPGLTVSMTAIDRRQIDLDMNFGLGLTYSYLGNTLLLEVIGGGLTGPQGITGATGPQGDVGPIGATGPVDPNDLSKWEVLSLRVPNSTELDNERLSWNSGDSVGAFASPLKLPRSGTRDFTTGNMTNVGSAGVYWSSTIDGNSSVRLSFNVSSVSISPAMQRATGASVRLIVDGTFTQQDFDNNFDSQTIEIYGLVYGYVFNVVTGKIWLDRNLGATQVATSSTDSASYGWLYQWGRSTDGHQIRTPSTTTPILSSSDQPGHGDFIILPAVSPFDWRSPQNDNLWQGVTGINNPGASQLKLIGKNGLKADYNDLLNLPSLITGATGPQGITGPQGGGETILSNNQTGPTYSLQLTDGAKMILMNSSSANTVVVSNLSWPLGSQVLIVQKGTGQTTIVPDGGVTLFSESNKNKIASRYSSVSIINDSNNPGEWYMFGNLTL